MSFRHRDDKGEVVDKAGHNSWRVSLHTCQVTQKALFCEAGLYRLYVGSDNNSTYKRYNPSYGFIYPFKGMITPFTGYLYSRGPSCTRLILPYHPSLPDLLTGCKYNELPATRIMIQKDIQQSKAFSNGTSCGSPKGQKTPSKHGTVFL